MKKFAVFSLLILCPIFSNEAAIINGFSQEKMILEKKIVKTQEQLLSTACAKTFKKLERQIKKLQKEYDLVHKKYQKTQWLIEEIRKIDPDLFDSVSNSTNAEGTLTHVFVRYVCRQSEEFTYFTEKFFKASAYTSVRQAKNNPNVCESLYGTNSITITVGEGCNALCVLGHEFAHVIYMVSNLKEYFAFYEKHYNRGRNKKFHHGHSPFDPGHQFIGHVEESFKNKYKDYLKSEKRIKQDSLIVL